MQSLTLGYSTCPNDTFAFHALAHRRVAEQGLSFAITLADVERLNQWAAEGRLDITKLSFAAVGHLLAHYALIDSGGAMGRGCGPLIVARPGSDLARLRQGRILTPGQFTTAHLLLGLYLGRRPRQAATVTFDRIMPAVAEGRADFGVIIHEGRFTYGDYGLIELLDLGAWWEEATGLPIPLGGIAVHRRVAAETAGAVEQLVRRSVEYAWAHPSDSSDYVRRHAQEMAPDVVRRHIDLYVNPFSQRYGREGRKAIRTLLDHAREVGLTPNEDLPLFVGED